jgi:hypothetical protein
VNRYPIDLQLHYLRPEHGYKFERYSRRGLYHWMIGCWCVKCNLSTGRDYTYPKRYATAFACGKLYGPYTNLQAPYNMIELSLFCPECMLKYHKARFKPSENENGG